MPKTLREVADFIALPISITSSAYPNATKHYIYLKPHEPRIADEDASRSLFLVNIPVLTSESSLRHLFATQLSAGRIERVDFSEATSKQSAVSIVSIRSNKKRKRMTADELEDGLNAFSFPASVLGPVRMSGSTAIAVFVDRPSMELSLKAARRASRQGTDIVWEGQASDDDTPTRGLKRYEAHKSQQYPARSTLLRLTDNFMTAYAEMEEARSRENARKRQLPDEDGFVTVTRGTKGGVLRKDEADELREKQKSKEKGLEDFYRFQMREKRKEQQGELLRKFEEDKKKIAEMKTKRGTVKPET